MIRANPARALGYQMLMFVRARSLCAGSRTEGPCVRRMRGADQLSCAASKKKGEKINENSMSVLGPLDDEGTKVSRHQQRERLGSSCFPDSTCALDAP